jgi:hypothetical protein
MALEPLLHVPAFVQRVPSGDRGWETFRWDCLSTTGDGTRVRPLRYTARAWVRAAHSRSETPVFWRLLRGDSPTHREAGVPHGRLCEYTRRLRLGQHRESSPTRDSSAPGPLRSERRAEPPRELRPQAYAPPRAKPTADVTGSASLQARRRLSCRWATTADANHGARGNCRANRTRRGVVDEK